MRKYSLFLILNIIFSTFLFSQEKTTSQTANKEVKIEFLTVETFKQKIMNYGDGNYEWKYIGTKPCIIDFYADWCRPCRMLSPILEEMAKKFDGQVIIYKINTEQQRELAGLFRISSIPALLFVPMNNQQPMMLRGYRDAPQLEQEINTYLLNTK